jgi:hypothetical protein
VFSVRYERGFYIPGYSILHSHCREILKSYTALTGLALRWRSNVSPVTKELGFITHKTVFIIITAVKTKNLTHHSPAGAYSGDVMCFL